ncbi:MAG: YggS family pyridoxal phosphate-dependent enzyme [Flavobacteriales bacterium]|nr:YggS family pyridoxal phosphate-dependent enzyme [Flavobacteriales bacterium]
MDRSALAERYEAIKGSIPDHVTLVAVSKTRSVSEIKAVYDLGHRAFGENYPQELKEKQPQLPSDIEWHFIGHLQSNKVKYIAPFVHLVHGVDSIKLLDELEKRAKSNHRIQDVLLQVHIAQEETKHGFSHEEIMALFEGTGSDPWPSLRIRGLMGMASNTDNLEQVRGEFKSLAGLFEVMKKRPGPHRPSFDTLSMGMSGDADEAISAGSTMVRIGTAIFGNRP